MLAQSHIRSGYTQSMAKMDVSDFWRICLDMFRNRLPKEAFESWFMPIRPISLIGATLTIQVPSAFFSEYLENNFADALSEVLVGLLGPEARLCYNALIDSTSADSAQGSLTTLSHSATGGSLVAPKGDTLPQTDWKHHLKSGYTFDSFLAGQSNSIPRALALAISQNPGTPTMNPLFIYGAPGVGKTHLLNAVGWELLSGNPQQRVLYVSAEEFLQQFITSARLDKIDQFTKYYQQVDVLLIDDLQVLISKTATQNAFFQIFNHLYLLGKQIVVTCDKPPIDLHGMQERLVSRMAGACITKIERPDLQLRRDIMDLKMQVDGVSLSPEVVDFVVTSITDNLRELEGAITSLVYSQAVSGCDIDLSYAKEVVGRIVRLEEKEITIEGIIQATSSVQRISVKDMRSKSRKQEIVRARQIVMWLAKKHTELSLSAIGDLLGGRCHATVLHGCQVIEDQLPLDKDLAKDIKTIEKKL